MYLNWFDCILIIYYVIDYTFKVPLYEFEWLFVVAFVNQWLFTDYDDDSKHIIFPPRTLIPREKQGGK